MTFTAQQSALFTVQKWHVRKYLKYERMLRKTKKECGKHDAGLARWARHHRKMSDSITPFLRP